MGTYRVEEQSSRPSKIKWRLSRILGEITILKCLLLYFIYSHSLKQEKTRQIEMAVNFLSI